MRLNSIARLAGVVLCLHLLSACTVTDLDEDGNPIIPADPNAKVSYEHMSLSEVADTLWAPKILPEAQTEFVEWEALKPRLEAGGDADATSAFVHFDGVIEAVDTSKIRGSVTLKVDDRSIELQTGRIVRGNAIRDASTHVPFDDFKNQIRFAQISREFNTRAIEGANVPDESWVGAPVSVIAAVTLDQGKMRDAVPIQIERRTP
ncbi:DUF2291 family protein [Larsenimonas suaedae]|uniref:DUF2291 family protein n=1 Tax=Larsenimonas suaedae TaxID=1851019 RepID=A0ABU1GTB5_9GAMM|nr:DUF2291 family protein [Larsenimonas suaedae]MCM2972377.1 DUF2291 family protein [Larsenimonas suaedae]MDR5894827.1 DUF2291 family protein [Larsenimonas suaedae]